MGTLQVTWWIDWEGSSVHWWIPTLCCLQCASMGSVGCKDRPSDPRRALLEHKSQSSDGKFQTCLVYRYQTLYKQHDPYLWAFMDCIPASPLWLQGLWILFRFGIRLHKILDALAEQAFLLHDFAPRLPYLPCWAWCDLARYFQFQTVIGGRSDSKMPDSRLEQFLTCSPCSSFALGAYSAKTVAWIVTFAWATAVVASFVGFINLARIDLGFAT